MKQRGRKGRLGDGAEPEETPADRPDPPAGMSEEMAAVWRHVVTTEAAGWFTARARQQLLGMYAAHVVEVGLLTERIQYTWAQGKDNQGTDYQSLDILGRMRDRETKAAANLATKLRLTPQAQEPPQQGQGKGKTPAPWQ